MNKQDFASAKSAEVSLLRFASNIQAASMTAKQLSENLKSSSVRYQQRIKELTK